MVNLVFCPLALAPTSPQSQSDNCHKVRAHSHGILEKDCTLTNMLSE